MTGYCYVVSKCSGGLHAQDAMTGWATTVYMLRTPLTHLNSAQGRVDHCLGPNRTWCEKSKLYKAMALPTFSTRKWNLGFYEQKRSKWPTRCGNKILIIKIWFIRMWWRKRHDLDRPLGKYSRLHKRAIACVENRKLQNCCFQSEYGWRQRSWDDGALRWADSSTNGLYRVP